MSVQVSEQVMVPMRDGTRLASDIYLPDRSGGPWPALLFRTPYGLDPDSVWDHSARQFAAWGYAAINQDVRGRYRSEGRFQMEGEGEDGYDTIAWVRAQPWCNGKIGMWGPSYMAWTQFAAARQHPPGLICLFAAVGDHYWHQLSQWGQRSALRQLDRHSWFLLVATEDPQVRKDEHALEQLQAASAALPNLQPWWDDPRAGAYPVLDSVLTVPPWAEVWPLREWPLLKLAPDYLPFWQRTFADSGPPPPPVPGHPESIEIPTFLVGGWFDVFFAGTRGERSGHAGGAVAPAGHRSLGTQSARRAEWWYRRRAGCRPGSA
ncbi:MAG: hypothetical protein CL878_04415 [Dehalococcoidia bacterium]|nr:hypothetical protein [Dehalococcoidia bacterium]